MKRSFRTILILTLILILIMVGILYFKDKNTYNSNNEVNSTSEDSKSLQNQSFTFGPNVNEGEVSEETKIELQNYINKLGNPEKDNISFNGFSAKFRQDGALILSVFVRNGYDYSIYDISAKIDIKSQGEVIASATFDLIEKEFGTLNAQESRVWNLVYEPEHIYKKNVELKEYILEYSTKYNKK